MIRSNAALAVKQLALDWLASFLYFPVWWYSSGAALAGTWCWQRLRNTARSFGVAVWLKNLFRPMFGQYDFWGRLISFIMRLVIIVWYSVLLLLVAGLMLALFVAWLLLPIFVVYEIFVQSSGILRTAKP